GTEVIASGTATSEGELTRSKDGSALVLTGDDTTVGGSSVSGTNTASVPRIVGLVGTNVAVDLTTTTTQFSTNDVRTATAAGSQIWAVGANSGVIALPDAGSGAGTVVSTTNTNIRVIHIFNNQLYYSTGAGSGVWSVGAGEPNSTSIAANKLPGVSSTSP